MQIEVEKIDTHEGISVKVLLDSGAMCHKSPARTKDSTVGGMGRTRAILRRTRRRVLKIEKEDKIR